MTELMESYNEQTKMIENLKAVLQDLQGGEVSAITKEMTNVFYTYYFLVYKKLYQGLGSVFGKMSDTDPYFENLHSAPNPTWGKKSDLN